MFQLHCLPFHLHLIEVLLSCKTSCSNFKIFMVIIIILGVTVFRIFMVILFFSCMTSVQETLSQDLQTAVSEKTMLVEFHVEMASA